MSKIDEKAAELSETLKADLGKIELDVLARPFTLADAIREGSLVTAQSPEGWGDVKNTACALTAAVISARAHGYL